MESKVASSSEWSQDSIMGIGFVFRSVGLSEFHSQRKIVKNLLLNMDDGPTLAKI